MPCSSSSHCSNRCSSCVDCTCGDNCQCTETLCRCQASSILNSLQQPASFRIEGMTCQSCVSTVQHILGSDSVVDLSTGKATTYVSSMEEAHEHVRQLESVGFDATLERVGSSSSSGEATTSDGLKNKSCHNGATTTTTSSTLTSTTTSPELTTNTLQSPLFEAHEDVPNEEDPLASPPQTTETIEFVVGGMTCTMCSNAITRALQSVEGVTAATVNLATNVATVEYAPQTTPSLLQTAIENAGYEVVDVVSEEESRLHDLTQRQERQVQKKKTAFVYSLVGTLPIFFLTMILPHIAMIPWLSETITLLNFSVKRESLLLWLLATPVQFGSGWCFYKSAHRGIASGQLGMDVLVALGTTASYLYAVSETLDGKDGHFFETSSVLISFVLLGNWMNSLAVRRTSEALTKLMNLQSKRAIRITPQQNEDSVKDEWNPLTDSYEEEIVDIRQVQPDDIVKVLRGASIPADGVVAHGEMTVDESMITGESIPVLKMPGSIVLGGTLCVETQQAASFVCVTGVGSSTALSQIVQLVQEAQTRQVPIQSLADTISSVFVPTVCTLSIITYMVWYALCSSGVVPQEWFAVEGAGTFSLMFGIACLVISCPCALGLATPTAVIVGTGVGASHGILMKGGEALEKASGINSVVFDKTGTLTQGKPCVTDFVTLNESLERNHLLWLLASLERNSEHPLATAVVSYAESTIDSDYLKENSLAHPSSFRALTGRGASGTIEGTTVAVGNRRFAALMDISITREVEECMVRLEQEGKTAILAAVDGTVCVVMGIADELKDDAAASIRYLVNVLQVDVWMVTGDNARTARAISQKLGLAPNRVLSEALPVAKVQQVKKLQKEGKVVAMIGDGINDSPALAQADVGMSLGTGAEIAAEASDMVLVRGHVADVCTALNLSRTIFRRIQWNFVWALFYNCLGIPIAAGVFYPLVHTRLPPTLAALAMALSSLSVVSNSLALRFYRPPQIEEQRSERLETSRHEQVHSTESDNDLTQSLLENDYTGGSELMNDDTEAVDNRTSRMEEGLTIGRDEE